MDAEQLFYEAVKKKVAFVVGNVFFCDGKGQNTLRMNFSFMNEEKIAEGVQRLAEVIKEEITKHNDRVTGTHRVN